MCHKWGRSGRQHVCVLLYEIRRARKWRPRFNNNNKVTNDKLGHFCRATRGTITGLFGSLGCQDSIHNRFISWFIQSFVGSSTLGNILKGTLEVPRESAGRCTSRRVSAAAPGSESSHLDHKSRKGVNTASRDSSDTGGRAAPTMMQI